MLAYGLASAYYYAEGWEFEWLVNLATVRTVTHDQVLDDVRAVQGEGQGGHVVRQLIRQARERAAD
jgi:hypothetical protein